MTTLVSVLQCTAPVSQPPPQQTPHPAPQQVPQPITQRPEVINNAEPLGQPEIPPNPLPFPTNTLRSSSPKPDPSELYLKSKAILDSKRTCISEASIILETNHCNIILAICHLCAFSLDALPSSLQLLIPRTWMCSLKGTRRQASASESSEARGQISR